MLNILNLAFPSSIARGSYLSIRNGVIDMTNWKLVHSSALTQPEEFDLRSSPNVVYQRRNIRQETIVDPTDKQEITQWVFEERLMTVAEYEALSSPTTQMLMQNLSDIEADILTLIVGEE
jgi:hypothetical protein